MLVCPECGASEPGRTTCSRDGAQLLDSGQDELLGRTVGSYRVARLLGRGGMGVVYLGVHPEVGSRVAIKVIRPSDACDISAVQRFFAEARSVNLIRHESIINVLDLAYLPDGRPYIVMEYVNGASLATWMHRGLSARRLLGIGVEILDALAAAHAKGIVHRDLKPDNVMLTPEGRVKLLDFGIAKLRIEGEASQHLTATGSVLGTPAYMSPEQARGRPADARADLYSFGIMLFEGLTGRVPFMGDSLFEVLRQHVAEPPPPLSAARSDLPQALQDLLKRMLAKDPEHRPASAAEAQALLLALVPHVPDTPPPPAPALVAADPMASRGEWETTTPPVQPPRSPRASWLKWVVLGALGLLGVFGALAALVVVAVAVAQLSLSRTPSPDPSSSSQKIPTTADESPPGPTEPVPKSHPRADTSPQPTKPTATINPRAEAPRPRDSPPPPLPDPTTRPTKTERETTPEASKAPEPAPPVPIGTGTRYSAVAIHSVPDGAKITFDGKPVGKAFVKLDKVLQGPHVVVASLPGYKTQTQNITVDALTRLVICRMEKKE